MAKKTGTEVFTSTHACSRPAWLQDDLYAYNHRHYRHRGMRQKQVDFYKDRKGIA